MSITRGYTTAAEKYTTIANDWMRDTRLSRRARGLLAELTTHRQGWEVTIQSLVDSGPEGRDAIQSAIWELEQYGYLVRKRTRTCGRMAGMDYVLQDPQVAPVTENPSVALTRGNVETPVTGFPPQADPHTKKNISLPTEEKEDQKYTRRKNSAGEETQKRHKFQGREPDDETSSPAGEDAPALGSDPTARQENLRKAAASGTTGGGLAERLKRGLEPQGMHVTASAVARTLNVDFALPRGPSRELQREMVDLFIRNHAQYTPNDKLPAWQRFLAQRSSITVDAKAILAGRERAEKEIGANPEDDAAWFARADANIAARRKKEAEEDELLRQH